MSCVCVCALDPTKQHTSSSLSRLVCAFALMLLFIFLCSYCKQQQQQGDLLRVEILNLGPLDGDEWGFTGSFAKENGGGFLTEHFPCASKAIWDIEGIYCSSRHIPGVRFAGLIHPGLIGTAPSAELLNMWNTREKALVDEEGTPQEKTLCGCLHTRPLACLPEPTGALLGQLGHFRDKQTDPAWSKIAAEAARTVPGRENGGNCDIKNLSRGAVAYFPVFVPNANLSMGDMHFSQGDGEFCCCKPLSEWFWYCGGKLRPTAN